MSYEFSRYEGDEHTIIPEYWQPKPERLYQMPTFDIGFIGTGSIIQDTKTPRVGIDAADKFEAWEEGGYVSRSDIGVMRLTLPDNDIDGFLVDLRYCSQRLIKRNLAFAYTDAQKVVDAEAYQEAEEYDKRFMNSEALGVILYDPYDKTLQLWSNHRELVEPFAGQLVEYVDYARSKSNVEVIDEEMLSKQNEPKTTIRTRDESSSPTQEQ